MVQQKGSPLSSSWARRLCAFPLRSQSWNVCKFVAIFAVLSKICSQRMELPVILATKQGKRMACWIQRSYSWKRHSVAIWSSALLWQTRKLDERCQMDFLKTWVLKAKLSQDPASQASWKLAYGLFSVCIFPSLFMLDCFCFHFVDFKMMKVVYFLL